MYKFDWTLSLAVSVCLLLSIVGELMARRAGDAAAAARSDLLELRVEQLEKSEVAMAQETINTGLSQEEMIARTKEFAAKFGYTVVEEKKPSGDIHLILTPDPKPAPADLFLRNQIAERRYDPGEVLEGTTEQERLDLSASELIRRFEQRRHGS